MAYLSLYRKWRPQVFEDVIGQEPITRTLANALEQGRVAHAYLFAGPRGTGKTTTAKLLAKALNCEKGPTAQPCDLCENCRSIREGRSMDVLEIDGASNRGIDEIRELRERVKFSASQGRYNVFIIDEVHMLTTEAFNALLKTLEEPPSHVLFVLATTEPHKLPATILSRCQRFHFARIPMEKMVERLQKIADAEKVSVEDGALHIIARNAEGGMRDAISLLDQAISYAGNPVKREPVEEMLGLVQVEVLYQLAKHLAQKDAASALRLLGELAEAGRDLGQLIKDLVGWLRQLLVYKVAPNGVLESSAQELEMLREQSQSFNVAALTRGIQLLGQAEQEARRSALPQLQLELAFVRMTELDSQDRLDRLEEMVQALSRGGVVAKVEDQPRPRPEVTETPAAVEPVPVTEPSPEPTGPAEDLTHLWQELLESLKRERLVHIHAFLKEGEPVKLDQSTFLIYFPAEYSFHQARVEDPKTKATIEKLLCQIVARPVQIECTNEERSAQVDPLAAKAKQLFGGRILGTRKED